MKDKEVNKFPRSVLTIMYFQVRLLRSPTLNVLQVLFIFFDKNEFMVTFSYVIKAATGIIVHLLYGKFMSKSALSRLRISAKCFCDDHCFHVVALC